MMLAVLAVALAPHYAPMFDKGHTWTYRLSLTDFDFVERGGKPKAVKKPPVLSTFTCTVTEVVKFPEAIVSNIHCDTEIDGDYGFRPDGIWVATAAGVFRAGADGDALPASAAEIAIDRPQIARRPTAKRTRTKDSFGGVVIDAVTREGGAWCAIADTTQAGAGDGAITKQCFRAGVGLSRGMLDYYGGFPRIVEYTAR